MRREEEEAAKVTIEAEQIFRLKFRSLSMQKTVWKYLQACQVFEKSTTLTLLIILAKLTYPTYPLTYSTYPL